jgi:hypothetical protein
MLLLRVVGILAAITIGSGLVAWVFTRDRRYLQLAGRVAIAALLLVLLVLVLMAAERLLIL